MTCIVVTVSETLGSAPREAGAAMIVTANSVSGTIGGGALEHRAIVVAREMLATGATRHELRLPLGPTLKQCCGGYVILDLAATEQQTLPQFDHRERLYLYGAGHVGRAVVAALSALPFDVVWVDEREDWAPEARPHCQAVNSSPIDAATAAEAGAYHLIMTHDHALDLDLCALLLARDDTVHVGLIGSASKRARFVSQLRARGLLEDKIDKLVCPIGIVGIRGKEPSIIAAGVAAELLLIRSRLMRHSDNRDQALHA
ncbi:MAG: xanthine dehydrogenase accessory protein XdhC [Pseudomonadota bacterium]